MSKAVIEIHDNAPELALRSAGNGKPDFATGSQPAAFRELKIRNFVTSPVRVCFRREKDNNSSAAPRAISDSFLSPVNLEPTDNTVCSVNLDAGPGAGGYREYNVLLDKKAWSTPKTGNMSISVKKIPIAGACTFDEGDTHEAGIVIDA